MERVYSMMGRLFIGPNWFIETPLVLGQEVKGLMICMNTLCSLDFGPWQGPDGRYQGILWYWLGEYQQWVPTIGYVGNLFPYLSVAAYTDNPDPVRIQRRRVLRCASRLLATYLPDQEYFCSCLFDVLWTQGGALEIRERAGGFKVTSQLVIGDRQDCDRAAMGIGGQEIVAVPQVAGECWASMCRMRGSEIAIPWIEGFHEGLELTIEGSMNPTQCQCTTPASTRITKAPETGKEESGGHTPTPVPVIPVGTVRPLQLPVKESLTRLQGYFRQCTLGTWMMATQDRPKTMMRWRLRTAVRLSSGVTWWVVSEIGTEAVARGRAAGSVG